MLYARNNDRSIGNNLVLVENDIDTAQWSFYKTVSVRTARAKHDQYQSEVLDFQGDKAYGLSSVSQKIRSECRSCLMDLDEKHMAVPLV